MHIAIYDDNIADRKQTERLLGRASDARRVEKGEGYFIDSYGNIEALMHYPQMYGIFFIDTCYSDETGLDIAKLLLDAGCSGEIVLLPGERYDYRSMAEEAGLYDRFHYLNKPILVKELNEMLLECEEAAGPAVSVMELRNEQETIRAREEEIICAISDDPLMLTVFLTGGRSIGIMTNIHNFYSECNAKGMALIRPVSSRVIINLQHISSRGLLHVDMSDGRRIMISPLNLRKLKKKTNM